MPVVPSGRVHLRQFVSHGSLIVPQLAHVRFARGPEGVVEVTAAGSVDSDAGIKRGGGAGAAGRTPTTGPGAVVGVGWIGVGMT